MSCDPNTLLEEAKCIINCIPRGSLRAVSVSLLCQLMRVSTPEGFSGLTHWWRADSLNLADGAQVGGTGSEWVDSVGGLIASQANAANRPTYLLNGIGGKPAVQSAHVTGNPPKFLGFATPNVISGDFTLFAVMKFSVLGAAFAHIMAATSGVSFIGNRQFDGLYRVAAQDDAGVGSQLEFGFATSGQVDHVITFRRSGVAGNNLKVFYNLSHNLSGADAAGVYTSNKLVESTGSFDASSTMVTAEVIQFNVGLTDDQISDLYRHYLKPRYSLP